MAKSDLFDGPLRFVSWLGAFPVIRSAHDEESIQTALAVLDRGGCLVMYCEGTMSRDGMPRAVAKPGIGRLATTTGAPVVPVAIVGARRGGRLRLPRVTMRFGEPLVFAVAVSRSRTSDQAVADEVLAAITGLHRALLDEACRLRRRTATTRARWPGRRASPH